MENNPSYNEILKLWVGKGNLIGNHTFSHPDIRMVTIESFILDIKRNEKYLSNHSKPKEYKFFRYPYLREGETQEKFNHVRSYLKQENYLIAPATIDFGDYLWNEKVALNFQEKSNLEALKDEYIAAAIRALELSVTVSRSIFNRDIKHILLLHLGIATAYFLDDVLKAYRSKGCRFIDFHSTLSDSVYSNLPNIITEKGLTLLGRILEKNELIKRNSI